jgi:hypothetical protein
VTVTSVGLGDSRTSTTLSSATAAWQENRKVLLIDAAERTRRLSELYGSHEVGAARNGHASRSQPGERLSADDYIRRLVYTGSSVVLPITRNYLRSRGLGVRTLWERPQRSARRGAGTPTVGPKREQRA